MQPDFKNILCTLILLTWLQAGFCQFKFESFTTSEGLSQGYIYDILEDRDGFIWFGTKDGLNRFDGYTFKTYTYNSHDPHSISNNSIYRLYEDRQGRMWISTADGLNIYNKEQDNFTRLQHRPGDAKTISGNNIRQAVVELGDGRFLVAPMEKSLNVISVSDAFPITDTSVSVAFVPTPTQHHVEDMFRDTAGKVWLVSGEKLFEFIPGTLTTIERKRIDMISHSVVHSGGGVWTNDRYFSEWVDTSSFPLFSQNITRGHGSFFLHDEENDQFWLGITDLAQLHIFDTRTWKRGSPIHPERTRLALFHDITPTRMYKDRAGIIWMGTNGYGIRKYNNNSNSFQSYAHKLSVLRIIPHGDQHFFIKNWGKTIRMDTDGKITNWPEDHFPQPLQNFLVTGAGIFWSRHVTRFTSSSLVKEVFERYDPVSSGKTTYHMPIDQHFQFSGEMLEDHQGHLWISGFGGQYAVLNPVKGTFSFFNVAGPDDATMLRSAGLTTIYEDKAGMIWLGSESGVTKIRYDHATATATTLDTYTASGNDEYTLNYGHVTSLAEDMHHPNVMWIATKGGGLNRLDQSSKRFKHITTSDGLCNNVVYGILSDESGNIWGSTNNGIFCLINSNETVTEQWQIRHFTKSAGLQDNEFNTGAFAKLSNGMMVFGGINGVSIFHPARVLSDSFFVKTVMTNLLIGNNEVIPHDQTGILKKSIVYTKDIVLRSTQNFFTLEFAALDLRASGQNMYRYQLEGIDHDWIENGNRRNVTYSHLPPGSYVFKVQGSNSLGLYSHQFAELNIRILPPWWRTWWAYLIYVLGIMLAIRGYFVFRMNRAKLESDLALEHEEAKRIRELDALKTQLYANITHEFRTPLTVILGMTNQIKSNPDQYLQNGLDMISRNGNNLLKLVNEMLDLAKLEGGKMTLEMKNGDIISFIRYHVESFQSLAATEQKQFHFLADADVIIMAFDAEKMRQIVANLFSNALKFTPANGNVYVSVSYEKDIPYPQSGVVVRVKDTGIGIPENQLAHIFDRFYQLDNSHTRKAEGTGIGLALTKELVRLMNGSIEVKSPPVGATKGTEFIIRFPVTVADDLEPAFSPAYKTTEHHEVQAEENQVKWHESTNGSVADPLILLVEDNADVVAYTASCLQEYKVLVGKDGAEGFEIAIEVVPDLIITDVMMPYMDGFEMCDKLRQDERTSHIPVIMLTAKADLSSKLEGIEKGADVYLEKPFHKEELLLRIRKLLEQRKKLQQYYSRQIGISTEEHPDSTIPQLHETHTIEDEFIQKVREVVETNFMNTEFNVERLCKLVFMSHSQLHRKLEALTNCSPNQFIRMVRLQRAKELLQNPSNSISTVATESGYSDPGYFARIFKKETGLTPQEWRGGILNK